MVACSDAPEVFETGNEVSDLRQIRRTTFRLLSRHATEIEIAAHGIERLQQIIIGLARRHRRKAFVEGDLRRRAWKTVRNDVTHRRARRELLLAANETEVAPHQPFGWNDASFSRHHGIRALV